MEDLDYWRLCDELNVVQTVLLLIGDNPSQIHEYVENWDVHERPIGYEATKTAVLVALLNGEISGTMVSLPFVANPLTSINDIDLHLSIVKVASLKQWLRGRSIPNGFFFQDATDAPDYMDPKHPRYAPKLAAAVRAWQAMEDEQLLRGKTPKSAMQQWLEIHYRALELTHKSDSDKHNRKAGDMNTEAVKDVAKIANWDYEGGAPKTPSK